MANAPSWWTSAGPSPWPPPESSPDDEAVVVIVRSTQEAIVVNLPELYVLGSGPEPDTGPEPGPDAGPGPEPATTG